jgi:hypothetical protein
MYEYIHPQTDGYWQRYYSPNYTHAGYPKDNPQVGPHTQTYATAKTKPPRFTMNKYLSPDQEAQSQQENQSRLRNYEYKPNSDANYAKDFVDYPGYFSNQPAGNFGDNYQCVYKPEERVCQGNNFPQQPYYGSPRDYNFQGQGYGPQVNSTDSTQYPQEEFAYLSLNEQNQPRAYNEQIHSKPLSHNWETGQYDLGYNYSNYSGYGQSTPKNYVTNNITNIVTKNIKNIRNCPPSRTKTAQNFQNNSAYQPISTPQ